jgi:hypothetical protein
MKECDNSKIHMYKQQIHIVRKSNNAWYLITSTKTITTLEHSATLHHTSPNYTSVHFTTLIDTSLPLIYTPLALRIYLSRNLFHFCALFVSLDFILFPLVCIVQ